MPQYLLISYKTTLKLRLNLYYFYIKWIEQDSPTEK